MIHKGNNVTIETNVTTYASMRSLEVKWYDDTSGKRPTNYTLYYVNGTSYYYLDSGKSSPLHIVPNPSSNGIYFNYEYAFQLRAYDSGNNLLWSDNFNAIIPDHDLPPITTVNIIDIDGGFSVSWIPIATNNLPKDDQLVYVVEIQNSASIDQHIIKDGVTSQSFINYLPGQYTVRVRVKCKHTESVSADYRYTVKDTGELYYYHNGAWQKCSPFYFDSGTNKWVQFSIEYYDGSSWHKC